MKKYLYYDALLNTWSRDGVGSHDLIYAYDTTCCDNWSIQVRYGVYKKIRACTAEAWSLSRADGTVWHAFVFLEPQHRWLF